MSIIYIIMNNIDLINDRIYKFQKFENYLKRNREDIVFVCVGNSDVWYDSFGPIVGTILKNVFKLNVYIYGDINNNIKLKNLNNYIGFLNKKYFYKKIIVIDAALTDKDNNNLIFKEGKIKCAYFNNNSIPFGDYSILCPIKQEESDLFNYKKVIENAILCSNIIKNLLKCKNII